MKNFPSLEDLSLSQKEQLKSLSYIQDFAILDHEIDDSLPCINCRLEDQDGKIYEFFVGWIDYKNLGHWQYAGKHEEANQFVINHIKKG